ncbi:MAG: hypothetical protein KGQ42_00445 [Alphaproteobacteria bacterium]|nr:hypothetical protein [Alphaproteobacteria bacterium]MDE2340657.1 hypothetical protein [Alphaproteobacteria bacterium]
MPTERSGPGCIMLLLVFAGVGIGLWARLPVLGLAAGTLIALLYAGLAWLVSRFRS